MTSFDLVLNPTGSMFAKTLQDGLNNTLCNTTVYRRKTPKIVKGRERAHFKITPHGTDKIEQLRRFQAAGVSAPKFCLNANEVPTLNCKVVFARKVVNGTNGQGIVEFNMGETVPAAPLYTEYIPKKEEYRIHVFNGVAIDVQRKAKRTDWEGERNTKIRNLKNGYVFVREGVDVVQKAKDLAVAAVQALGYEYGAVDMIYNEKKDTFYVLEVNSRPGLEGQTVQSYVNAIANKYGLK